MKSKVLKVVLWSFLLFVVGFVGYRIFWPRIILLYTLNSLPNDERVKNYVRDNIVLIVFDEKTEKALGKNTPEVFRKNLADLIPIIEAANPSAIMVDAIFEKETAFDTLLQERIDARGFHVVWARNPDKQSRFTKRRENMSAKFMPTGWEPLPLGHIELVFATVEGRKLELFELCKMSRDEFLPHIAIPSLALLTFEISVGLYHSEGLNCTVWEKGYESPTGLKLSYDMIPKITDKNGKKWIPIRYMGQEGFFKRVSFIDVLNFGMSVEKTTELQKEIGNKIVLIGAIVPPKGAERDRHITEVGEMDGLEINANMIATIMRAFINK